jgi:hypothetical protein
MIYLLQSKDGGTTGVNTLAQAEAKTRSGAYSISGYAFGKGSTIARHALRIGRDIMFSRVVNVDGNREFLRDPVDVKTALKFINSTDVLITCNVSKSNSEETHWDLSGRVDGKAGRVDFVSKSMAEIKASLKASREKVKISKATPSPVAVGVKRRRRPHL